MTPEQLSELLDRKFGSHRGRNTRAASALKLYLSNLSQALVSGKLPPKHIDTLLAMPDYAPPVGISYKQTINSRGCNELAQMFTTKLTPHSARLLSLIARVHCKPGYALPDFAANLDATARTFEIILEKATAQYLIDHPEDYAGALEASKRAEERSIQQFNESLQSRKQLVADELIDNEVSGETIGNELDEEDPLA